MELRDVDDLADYESCARLQVEVWGFSEFEVVPAGHLIAMHHYGGTCIGAFDGGRMVGFVFGFPGWEQGHPFHHSHMLAVVPEFRGRRLGEDLKWAQRERVLAQGLTLVNWTFDPLQAPNANLNINRLGATCRHYKVNLYGTSESPLHGGIPTDRFEAEWRIESERVANLASGGEIAVDGWKDLPVANRTRREPTGLLRCEPDPDLSLRESELLIEVPRTITDLMERGRELAMAWRLQTRALFQEYFQRGYVVESLHREEGSAFYRLVHYPSEAAP